MSEKITSEESGSDLPPAWGSDRYKRQVERIFMAFTNSALQEADLSSFITMYIFDPSYNRAAICEAEKKIKKEKGWPL